LILLEINCGGSFSISALTQIKLIIGFTDIVLPIQKKST
jgi:hypothetical protein